MIEGILLKLKEKAPGYVSGAELGKAFGITRTAVWKYINQLKEEGYVIESSSKKGYKLASIPDILNKREVISYIKTEFLGKEIYYFDTIDSTNNYAKKIAEDGCEEGTVVISDCQIAGKGRRGREWASLAGKGIYMSVVLKPLLEPSQMQLITLAASVAVAEALKEQTGMDLGIKWPNDIILDARKLCGILTEMTCETDKINYVILGLGVNVNQDMEDFPADLRDKAVSLKAGCKQLTGENKTFNRAKIIASILLHIEKYYKMLQSGLNEEIIDKWRLHSITLGKQIMCSDSRGSYLCIAEDITEDGHLVVKCEDGSVRELLSGEVSIKGVMGYI